MAWRPSCEQGGRSSVHVAPNRVAGRRVAVVPRYTDGAMRGAAGCDRFRGRGGALLSASVAGRVAGDAGPPGRSPPAPATPFGGESSAMRCGSSYGPDGSSGSSSSPSGSRPRASSTSGGSPRNVPIGTPPFTSGGDSNGRRGMGNRAAARQRRPPRGTGHRPPPGSAGPSRGTGYRPPPTASNATSELRSARCPAARRQGWQVVSRQGAGSPSVHETSETGQVGTTARRR
jgi:hypothetical protein